MLTVRLRRANQRLGEVVNRRVCHVAGNVPRKPLRDFLEQPPVAVRILKRKKGAVTETLGVRPVDADIQARKPATSPVCTVKYLARVGARRNELLMRSLDVGDRQEQTLGGTGRGRG
jgi:hypothetical protein